MQNRLLFLDAATILQHSALVEGEFTSLETKVEQFVSLCERLRAENIELRQQLAAARSHAKRLGDKVEGAKAKLEMLLTRLPD